MLAVPAEDAGGQKRKHASADACLIGSLIRLVDTSGLEGSGTQWQSGETGGARRADRDTREFFVWTRVNGFGEQAHPSLTNVFLAVNRARNLA